MRQAQHSRRYCYGALIGGSAAGAIGAKGRAHNKPPPLLKQQVFSLSRQLKSHGYKQTPLPAQLRYKAQSAQEAARLQADAATRPRELQAQSAQQALHPHNYKLLRPLLERKERSAMEASRVQQSSSTRTNKTKRGKFFEQQRGF